MPTHPRISCDPDIVFGKPAVKGTRLSVEFILDLLAAEASEAEILENYPQLTHQDILACVTYARDLVAEQRVIPSAAA
jgi:uncharacterized protein (DUF433 family)